MIGPDGEGRLNDWDLYRSVNTDWNSEGPQTVRQLACDGLSIHARLSTGDLAVHVHQVAHGSWVGAYDNR